MKKYYLFIASLILIVTTIIFSITDTTNITYSTYASTSGSPGGKTNSPGDAITCTQCHGGSLNPGNATAIISVPGLVSGYTPGQTYTINISISGTSSSKIGFEATVERDANNSKTGTIIITDGTRTKTVNGGNAITHKSSGTSASGGAISWSFNWTAPTTGTGNVTFYAAFNASNGLNNTGGDQIYTSTLTVNEATTNIAEYESTSFNVYPNPFLNTVNLNSVTSINKIKIYSVNGSLIKELNVGSQKATLNLENYESGIYFMKVFSSNGISIEKLIKRSH